MIDRERGFVFVHVPKTAGMSMYAALGVDRGFGHLRLSDHHDVDGLFSFAFVRNPWDRLVSVYHYLRAGGRANDADLAAQAAVADAETFDAFVVDLPEYQRRLAEVPARGWGVPTSSSTDAADRRFPHLLPQTTWTHEDGPEPVVDFVGRYERLGPDVRSVGERIGATLVLGRENASTRGDYRDYFGHTTRAIVADAYRADIDAFGYRF